MKIEVGKRYINAKGGIVDIEDKISIGNFTDTIGRLYESSGRTNLFIELPQDLSCEVVPEIITAWKEGYIETWKDVLQDHIDWWTPRK